MGTTSSPIATSIDISAPRSAVWEQLAAVETHAEWMHDAASTEFLADAQRGVGTRIRVRARIEPFNVADVMEFISWRPPSSMVVTHIGAVGGAGQFDLEQVGSRTRLVWTESLTFPWYFGGGLGLILARPILQRVFAANMRRFATAAESGAFSPG